MKQIKTWASAIVILLLTSACNSNAISEPSINDYATQYNIDNQKIENYLKTHSVTVINNPGFIDDQSVTFTEVSSLNEASIWGSNPDVPKASLLFKNKVIEGVTHKIYYLKLREGVGTNATLNNQITCYYKGLLLNNSVFDASPEGGSTFALNQLIYGWREILPEFKMGTITNGNQYDDFGAGVMFLPSALGYYNNVPPSGTIPAYSPLIFSFKLYKVI